MQSKTLYERLKLTLPATMARHRIDEYLGGAISSKYLSNLAARKEGPEFIKMGRKAVYVTEDLLNWLENRPATSHDSAELPSNPGGLAHD